MAEEFGSHCFSIWTVIWYEVVNKIQDMSKPMQPPPLQTNVAVNLLKKARDALMFYRNMDFSDTQTTAKAMCNRMNREAELKQRQLRTTKRHFDYESQDEPTEQNRNYIFQHTCGYSHLLY